jgi:hypothetical protein
VTITEAWDGLPLLSVRLHPRLEVRAADVTTTREAPRFWHVAVPILFVAALLIAFVVLLGRRLARSATRLRHRAKALVPA